MSPKNLKALRISLEWGAVLGSVIALLSHPPKSAIGSIAVFGGIAAFLAVMEHGWLHAPKPIGTPIRTMFIGVALLGVFGGFGYAVWPAAPRAHIRVENFEFLPYGANQRVPINIYIRNDGEAMATHQIFSLIALTTSTDDKDAQIRAENLLWGKFVTARQPEGEARNIPPHTAMSMYVTLYGEPLTPFQADGLKQGKFFVWFLGRVEYKDADGILPPTEFCIFYAGNPKVVHACRNHYGDVVESP